MMGFALNGPVNMFGDNRFVILDTPIPSSQLKKKVHACAHHRVRDMITCQVIRLSRSFDKDYWTGKCFKCDKTGHPATHRLERDDGKVM
jgi:hypothetical protein